MAESLTLVRGTSIVPFTGGIGAVQEASAVAPAGASSVLLVSCFDQSVDLYQQLGVFALSGDPSRDLG